MSRQLRVAVGLFSLLLFVAMPAQALGPVDGEVSAVWWNNEYAVDEGGLGASEDAAAPGFLAELWLFNRYGLRAGVYSSDLDDVGLDSSDYMSVDLLWRAFSPTENSFFALGAGWTEMDLSTIGLDGDTSGARLTAEGRVGIIALLYLYGQGAYMPALDDAPATDPALGRFAHGIHPARRKPSRGKRPSRVRRLPGRTNRPLLGVGSSLPPADSCGFGYARCRS
jgi:hypothetical protein